MYLYRKDLPAGAFPLNGSNAGPGEDVGSIRRISSTPKRRSSYQTAEGVAEVLDMAEQRSPCRG